MKGRLIRYMKNCTCLRMQTVERNGMLYSAISDKGVCGTLIIKRNLKTARKEKLTE